MRPFPRQAEGKNPWALTGAVPKRRFFLDRQRGNNIFAPKLERKRCFWFKNYVFLLIFIDVFPRVFMFLKVKGALQKHRPCRKTKLESDHKMSRFLDDSGDCRFCFFALLQRGKSILMILGNLCPRCPFPSPWRGICNYVYFVFFECAFLKKQCKSSALA